ncbi:MAG: DUF262 domain-containing protein [Pirellulaceae bacterium]
MAMWRAAHLLRQAGDAFDFDLATERQRLIAAADTSTSSATDAELTNQLTDNARDGNEHMARIENHKYSIEDAFRECFYVVPDYQREYVWTEKEVTQLLEDIDEQIDAGSTREYFVGMVLVSRLAGKRTTSEVIDGQQRLTTFYLLLCALRHRFQGTPQHHSINGLIFSRTTRRVTARSRPA